MKFEYQEVYGWVSNVTFQDREVQICFRLRECSNEELEQLSETIINHLESIWCNIDNTIIDLLYRDFDVDRQTGRFDALGSISLARIHYEIGSKSDDRITLIFDDEMWLAGCEILVECPSLLSDNGYDAYAAY